VFLFVIIFVFFSCQGMAEEEERHALALTSRSGLGSILESCLAIHQGDGLAPSSAEGQITFRDDLDEEAGEVIEPENRAQNETE
jgi:hypothetical protein